MRVIDKRMFDENGELREDVKQELADFASKASEAPSAPKDDDSPSPARTPAVSVAPVEDTNRDAPEKPADAPADAPADPNFARLVITLSNQAGLYLGLLVDPLNPAGTVDVGAAKGFIDMLVVLEAKTRGRLNSEEAQLLESVLYELKMAYVERSRRPARV